MNDFNPIQDGSFEGCSQMEGGGGKKGQLLKICHTYPTMIEFAVMPSLKKTKKNVKIN